MHNRIKALAPSHLLIGPTRLLLQRERCKPEVPIIAAIFLAKSRSVGNTVTGG